MTIKEINERLPEIAKEREAKIEELRQKIHAEEERHEKAIRAAGTDDPKVFHAAMDAKRAAQDAIDFYQRKLDALNNGSRISQEDYERFCEAIMQELTDIVSRDKERVVAALREFKEIYENESHAISSGNSLLHHLQHDLMLDDACRAGIGGRYNDASLEKKFTDFSLCQFLGDLTNGWFFREATEHGNDR